jgi:hypothetical protein
MKFQAMNSRLSVRKILSYFIVILVIFTVLLPHASYKVVKVRIVLPFTFHIGIMTHQTRSLEYHADHIGIWGSEFLQSRYSGGMHFVSEGEVPIATVPTAIANLSSTERLEMPARLSRSQAVKRITSLRYFLTQTTGPFYIFTTDNAYIWVKNIQYLVSKMHRENITRGTHFLWGNCMASGEREFIQGGSGYLMSRETAKRLLNIAAVWLPTVSRSEDVAFERAMNMVDLTARTSASEFVMGQYINWPQQDAMEDFNLSTIASCSTAIPEGCRPFLFPFNKIVVLHRLSGHRFPRPPRPVYDFPDNLFWYQRTTHAYFCLK